jgi:hypothetical protein
MDYVNGDVWGRLEAARAAYQAAEPFPHVVIDGFLRPEVAGALADEFPRVDHRLWKHHLHLNSHKFACNAIEVMPPLFRDVLRELNSKPVRERLEALTGISDLVEDEGLEGGGLHQITRGGFLEIHADFNYHPTTGYHRRLNLLVYLNRDWEERWDGNLELWDRPMSRCVRSIAPVLNRGVLFRTTDQAYHGHPRPLRCPPGASRKSMALYYYTKARPREETSRPHSTLYQRSAGEPHALRHLRLLGRLLVSPSLPQVVRASLRKLSR